MRVSVESSEWPPAMGTARRSQAIRTDARAPAANRRIPPRSVQGAPVAPTTTSVGVSTSTSKPIRVEPLPDRPDRAQPTETQQETHHRVARERRVDERAQRRLG